MGSQDEENAVSKLKVSAKEGEETGMENEMKLKNKTIGRMIFSLLFICIQLSLSTVYVKAEGYYYEAGAYEVTRDNWANPVQCYTSVEKNGNTKVMYSVLNKKKLYLMIDVFNKRGVKINSRKISVPGTKWGGKIYCAPDGCYYITSAKNQACYITKYNSQWKKKGTTYISGKKSYTTVPYQHGNSDIALVGKTLVVHLSTKASNGHQMCERFYINSTNMKLNMKMTDFEFVNDYHYVSHSFNQFVRYDGKKLIFLDHGDANNTRGIYVSSCIPKINAKKEVKEMGWGNEKLLMKAWGGDGQNYTGITVDGFEIGRSKNIIAGTAIPHNTFSSNRDFSKYNGGKNAYVILLNKDLNKSRVKWLTNYSAKSGKNVYNLRMIKINKDRFIIVYGVESGEKQSIYYKIINSKGKVLKKGYKKNCDFYCNSVPDYRNNVLQWCHYVHINAGVFIVRTEWNIKTNKITIKNLNTGIKNKIKRLDCTDIWGTVTRNKSYKIGQKDVLACQVYSDAFSFDSDHTSPPAVWSSSNPNVVEVTQEETMTSSVVTTWEQGVHKTAKTSVKAKSAGRAKIKCQVGDKSYTWTVDVTG